MPDLHLILGPPGTGKTTRLVDLVRRHGDPKRTALVSFTQAAAHEARDRVAAELSLDAEAMPHFTTIHSLAYRSLKLTRSDVVDRKARAAFGEEYGEIITPGTGALERSFTPGDLYFRATEIAAAKRCPIDEIWPDIADERIACTASGAQEFADAYARWKQKAGLYDFTDMLWVYAMEGKPLDVDLAVIDEAQDLTALQWQVVRRAFANARRLIVAGDDDQAIYEWAGADVAHFLALGDEAASVDVLRTSHRLPRAVHALAQDVASRIARRYVKAFDPRDEAGSVQYHGAFDATLLSGKTRVLARNGYQLDAVEMALRDAGVCYTRDGAPSVHPQDVATIKAWLTAGETVTGEMLQRFCIACGHDKPSVPKHATLSLAEWCLDVSQPWQQAFIGWSHQRVAYYEAVMAAGTKLSAPPCVYLSTIHAAKGAEAETVVLLTEQSARTQQGMQTNPDAEHRVFYVGVTRAIRTLHVVYPAVQSGYPLAL